MLSIGKVNNSDYYENLASEDYYTDGGEPQGRFLATEGNCIMGFAGVPIEKGQLAAMLDGFDPLTGEDIASNAGDPKKSQGLDLCFSAPKSVSVAWATASDEMREAISKAQALAVQEAIIFAEGRTTARVKVDGSIQTIKAKILAASFEHSTSRAIDPQLHTHVLVAAHGVFTDVAGNIVSRSIKTHDLMLDKKMVGAAYRVALAKQMQDIGFSVERTSDNFDLLGSDKKLEKKWSKRSVDIEKELLSKGFDSAKAKSVAALNSREVKGNIDRTELLGRWQAEASDFDLKFNDNFADAINQSDLLNYTNLLTTLTDSMSTFNDRALRTLIMQELQGVGNIEDVNTHVKALLESGELIKLGESQGTDIFTTPAMLVLEDDVVSFAKSTHDSTLFKASEASIQAAIDKKVGISIEQQEALRHVCGNGLVTAVIGAAGTGKSYMLDAAREVFEKEGKNVIGCALAGKAAGELEKSAGIKSSTIHALLHSIKKGATKITSETVIVVDEAAMVDTKLLADLTNHVKKHSAKIVMVGDNQQLQAIGAGGVFGKIAEDTNAAEILTVRRQEVEWSKQAGIDLREGRIASAMSAYQDNNALHFKETEDEAHSLIVEDFIADQTTAHEKIMIAGTNSDVNALNKKTRETLKDQGLLSVSVVATLHDKKNDITTHLEIAEGERLRLRGNNKKMGEKGVMNGDLCTVNSLSHGAQGQLIVNATIDRTGETLDIDTSEYTKMQHGYCITAHASQGATLDNVYSYTASFTNKELAYVSQSRHRQEAHIYAANEVVGDVASLIKQQSRTSEKRTALQMAAQNKLNVSKVLEEERKRQATTSNKKDILSDPIEQHIDDAKSSINKLLEQSKHNDAIMQERQIEAAQQRIEQQQQEQQQEQQDQEKLQDDLSYTMKI